MKNKENIILIIISTILVLLIINTIMLMNTYKYRNEDVNKDGKVNALDLLIVQKYILEEE